MKSQISKSPSSSYTNRNKFNYASKPMLPIKNLQNIKILSLQISPEGKSGGVIFIEATEGSFVVKPCNSSPSDFFYNQLALTLDVNVPVMTIINCYDNEFKKLVFEIEKYALADQILSARLKNKLDYPFYEIMEFIPGVSFVSLGCKKFQELIHPKNIYRLYSMGIVLGFDFVINNNDRFKCIWRGEGNLNNVILEIDTLHQKLGRNWVQRSRDRDDLSIPFDNFVFIDHDGSMPSTNEPIALSNIEKYMQKVTDFQLHIVMFLRQEYSSLPPEFDKLIKQIKFFTQHELTTEECISICQGIIYLTKKFIMAYQRNQIHDLHASIIREVKESKNRNQISYWNDYWNNQFTRRVNMNFCELYYIKISSVYTTYPELINKIYEKVDSVMQLWKQSKTQRKRVSYLGKNKKEDQAPQQEQNQQNSEKHSNINDHENEQQQIEKQNSRKRKWREKLNIFKEQNYKN